MSETSHETYDASHKPNLQNPQQIVDIKSGLEELFKFVFQLEAKKAVTKAQAEVYRASIRQLVVQLSIDAYTMHAWAARSKGKHALALHYFELALKLMRKEQPSHQNEGRIKHIESLMAEIRAFSDADASPDLTAEQKQTDSHISSEWDEFAKNEESWKKKQLYD